MQRAQVQGVQRAEVVQVLCLEVLVLSASEEELEWCNVPKCNFRSASAVQCKGSQCARSVERKVQGFKKEVLILQAASFSRFVEISWY